MQEIICFHNPEEENGWLSNWYLSRFTVDGITFSSMEQYMMYMKAEVFGDDDIKKEIMSTDDVGRIKALGRQVHNYNNTVWNGMRQIIIYEGLYAKYSQNDDLKEKLLRRRLGRGGNSRYSLILFTSLSERFFKRYNCCCQS